MKIWIASFLLICGSLSYMTAQRPAETEDEYDKKYKERIRLSHIYGVYIPEDLSDAFSQLNKLIEKDSKKAFKEIDEMTASRKLHFSLGRWMIHNWGFYGGSRLSEHIKKIGIHHPDDMARFIIITYHRYLNKKDLEVLALVETFKSKQAAEKEQRQNRGKVLSEETKVREQKKSDQQ